MCAEVANVEIVKGRITAKIITSVAEAVGAVPKTPLGGPKRKTDPAMSATDLASKATEVLRDALGEASSRRSGRPFTRKPSDRI